MYGDGDADADAWYPIFSSFEDVCDCGSSWSEKSSEGNVPGIFREVAEFK